MYCPFKLDSHPDNHSQTPRGVLRISNDRDDRLGAKIKLKKKPQGLPTKPPKIPGSKLNPEKSHPIEYASTTTNPRIALNTQKYPDLN